MRITVATLCMASFVVTSTVVPSAAVAAPAADYSQRGMLETVMHALGPNPDFDGVERYVAGARQGVARHELDEDIESQIFQVLGLASIANANAPALHAWRHSRPRSALPVLAPLAGRLGIAAPDLAASFETLGAWQPPSDVLAEIKRIEAVLSSVKPTASHDPYWYTLMAEVMIARRAPLAHVDALVDEGLARHPDNLPLVVVASNHYLGKWSGSADALEAFAARMADKFAAREGQAMYARIYGQAMRAQYAGQLFDKSKVDWQRLMTGERDLLGRRPSDHNFNRAAVIGCLGGNRNLLVDAVTDKRFLYQDVDWYQIVPNYSGSEAYQMCRQWAGSSTPARSETP